MKKLPERGVGFPFYCMHTKLGAMKCKTVKTSDGVFQRGERRHEAAVGGHFKIFASSLSGDRKREGMKFLAVLDELVDIFDHVFRKRRSQQAAMTQRAVAEFRAALAPRKDFVAM